MSTKPALYEPILTNPLQQTLYYRKKEASIASFGSFYSSDADVAADSPP